MLNVVANAATLREALNVWLALVEREVKGGSNDG